VDRSLFQASDVPGDRPLRLLYAGTIGMNHGADVLVRAAARCQEEAVPVEIEFLGSGSERSTLEALALELRTDNVVFRDPVPIDQLSGEIARCHVGAVTVKDLPTTRGGRPSKLFPFLAAARPILFAGAGEAAEIIGTAGAGLVVENTVDAMFDAIKRLSFMTDNELNVMGRAGRVASERFAWPTILDNWVASIQGAPDVR
jgi:colanic acid biosynthesis glycosyl transferase WcaI